VGLLTIWEFVEGLFGEDVFELFVRLGHYIFEAHGAGPFCGFHKLLGYRLSGLDLCRVFVQMKCNKKSVTSIQINRVWVCKSLVAVRSYWVLPGLRGPLRCAPSQHDFILGGLAELSVE